MKLLKVVANKFKLCDKDFTISFVPTGNKTVADKEFELQEIAEDLYVFSTLGQQLLNYYQLCMIYFRILELMVQKIYLSLLKMI